LADQELTPMVKGFSSIKLVDVESQIEVLGGTLFSPPIYEGFLQTDREGIPKGVIVLDPEEMIAQPGVRP
jgi:hypothetical protein